MTIYTLADGATFSVARLYAAKSAMRLPRQELARYPDLSPAEVAGRIVAAYRPHHEWRFMRREAPADWELIQSAITEVLLAAGDAGMEHELRAAMLCLPKSVGDVWADLDAAVDRQIEAALATPDEPGTCHCWSCACGGAIASVGYTARCRGILPPENAGWGPWDRLEPLRADWPKPTRHAA